MSEKKKGRTRDHSRVKKKPDANMPDKKHGDDGDAMDFGGLPRRDLKKNLGCG